MSWFDDEETTPGDHSPPPTAGASHDSSASSPGGGSPKDGGDRSGHDAPDRGVSWGVAPGPGLWPWGRRARQRRARRGQAKAALSERARRLRQAGEADSSADPPVLTQPWRQVPARQNLLVIASLVAVVAMVVGLAWWMSSGGGDADPSGGDPVAATPPPEPAASSEPTGGTRPSPESPSASAAGGPAAGEAPDVVCRRFATMYLAADAADDATPAAARQRAAARYGTRELQSDLAADQTERAQPSWQQLQKHQAHIETTPRPYAGAAPPPDGAGVAYAAVTVARTAVAADGWSQTLPTATVYCTLSRAGTTWRVNQVDLSLGGSA